MIPRHLLILLSISIAFTAGLDSMAKGQGTSPAKQDGKSFGAAIAGKAQNAARTAPTADTVPNFGGTPSQSALFDNPDAIAAQAGAAASSNPGYRAVRSSIDTRPRIAPVDIEATIARSKAISTDPSTFVSGMGLSGGQGSCRELPPSVQGSGFYEATCNSGVALQQSDESCTIPLQVSVNRTTRYRYWCSDYDWQRNGVDDCALFAQGSCERTGMHPGRCLQGTPKNCVEPGEPVFELLCNAQVSGTHMLGTEDQTQLSEQRDESTCAGLAGDGACTAVPESCTSSDPVTRIIDGVPVTRPCWAWTRSYHCDRKSQAQDCTDLDSKPECSFVRQDCLTEDDPCTTWERVYRCPVPDQMAGPKQFICDGDVYCIGGDCETIDRQPNTEFQDAAVALNAAAQAGREFDPDSLTLFKGERETCHKTVFGLLNCCAGKAFPLIPYGQLLVALGCDREEILLHQRDAQGLCAYVGSYCSSSVLGVCVTKKKVYCCFESKLSRILQEQGRPQLGLSWDKPKREACRGFTIDEFARLDLSKMDFSEVYAEFADAAKLPEELGTVTAMQQKIADFYAINGTKK
ncbi:conjugal transfer protein TraN [Sphingomonas sp. ID1715]|uniref:conjugal transfer protein TraN n=1 Tax=Sphingomonas sp. ID1715 TaxID=1656898 RepID=UPI001489FA04|nr:conjugal transfer protein TraN [Sphingomonas sp. ID1715]NNM77687.1 conjugal transfer protein TraN [Sphingomonas sp. ID1715]